MQGSAVSIQSTLKKKQKVDRHEISIVGLETIPILFQGSISVAVDKERAATDREKAVFQAADTKGKSM